MLYSGSPPVYANKTGLEDRQLRSATYINNCLPSHNAFKQSKCHYYPPTRKEPQPLHAWIRTCLEFHTHYDEVTGIPNGSSFTEKHDLGHCEADEICANDFGPAMNGEPGPQIAVCIEKTQFDPLPRRDSSENTLKRLLDTVLDSIRGAESPSKQPKVDSSDSIRGSGRGSNTVITMSQTDGQTPIKAKALQFSAWNAADGQNGDAEQQQSKRCRMCSDLEMAEVSPKADHLELEASLLTAGTVAGILWIAVMSG